VRCYKGSVTDSSALLEAVNAALAGRPRRQLEPAERLRQVLIVDDNAINLFLARDFLKDMPGFEVETAEGGEAGLARAIQKRFDLILMDMQMPMVDGQTATREIRRHEEAQGLAPIPIVAFTAHSGASDLESARVAGCDGYLIKPAKKEKMIKTVLQFVPVPESNATAVPSSSAGNSQSAVTRPLSNAKIRAQGNDRFRQHMSGYLEKLAESLARAEDALAEQDFKTVREIVHKWIGPSATLGIPELSDEGGLLQDAARNEQEQLVRRQLGHTREYATRLEIVYANGESLTAPLPPALQEQKEKNLV
jgi:CheY-like chemotaxis protein